MNSIVILLVILVIASFILYNSPSQENFVQVKSDYNINKNPPMIKPIQVTPSYNQTVKIYDRDAPVTDPHYSPNIIPNLLSSSANLNLPGQSNGQFEQSNNNVKTNKISTTSTNQNPKAIRPESGHLIRPIELDSSPSVNTQVEKPYLNKDYPQAYSEYLEYTNVIPSSSNYAEGIFSDQEENKISFGQIKSNTRMEISNLMLKSINTENKINDINNEDIAKKIIKKAALLSITSLNNVNSINSVKTANYAVGYLKMLRDIMSDSEISSLVNIDLQKFGDELEKIQKSNTEKITLKCSNSSTDKKYLLEIAAKL